MLLCILKDECIGDRVLCYLIINRNIVLENYNISYNNCSKRCNGLRIPKKMMPNNEATDNM